MMIELGAKPYINTGILLLNKLTNRSRERRGQGTVTLYTAVIHYICILSIYFVFIGI